MTETPPSGTVIAELSVHAEGVVMPGPNQTWDDVPGPQPTTTEEKDD